MDESLKCPFCHGKGKSREESASGYAPKNWRWETHPWPESEDGDGKLRSYAICQACDGSGLYSDYCARVLAGEFPATQPNWREFAGSWTFTQDPLFQWPDRKGP